MKRTNKQTLKS